ncbi:MAG: cytochrome oxidase assembly protein ShyY1 [Candidatus Aldehydirespiratoraceae bacterium]|jgi:cytochrome oxidase assembly protein ShyY1
MYRFLFRPAWLAFHLIVVAGVLLMATLGVWQLERLSERKDFNRTVRERSQTAPIDFTTLLDDLETGLLDPTTAEWLPVTTSGTFLPDQVLEFNNSQGGRAGDNVVAALITDDGATVIVNRGFIPLGFDTPEAPQVGVTIFGFVRLSEVRDLGGLTDADDGEPLTEIRRIDIPRLAEQLPGDVAPIFVQLTRAVPEIQVGDPEPVVFPVLDNGPHLSYAIQWFVFSLCVAIGWVLAVRRSLASRRKSANRDAAVELNPESREETLADFR